MFKCWECDAVLNEPDIKEFTDMVEYWGAIVPMVTSSVYCPERGSEDFDEYTKEEI